MSADDSRHLSTPDPGKETRCSTYWWLYGRMSWAAFVAEDESENNQVRRDAVEKRDANLRGIGYHMAECKQCQEWFHSFKRE